MVSYPEQIIGAQPRLHVFESHVILGGTFSERMTHIGEHLPSSGANIDFFAFDPERFTKFISVRFCAFRGGETGQGVGQNLGFFEPEAGGHLTAHQNRLGGI